MSAEGVPVDQPGVLVPVDAPAPRAPAAPRAEPQPVSGPDPMNDRPRSMGGGCARCGGVLGADAVWSRGRDARVVCGRCAREAKGGRRAG